MMTKAILLSFLAASLPATAATLTLQAGVNGYDHITSDIRENGTAANGAQALIGYQSGATNNNSMRAVMAFSLSSIPAGATIDSISLLVTSDGSQSGNLAGVGTINLHQIVPNGDPANNMVEGQINWANWKTNTAWTTPGGDYTTLLSSSTVNQSVTVNTTLDAEETLSFASSTAFIAAAQAALDAGLPLEFILIAPTAEANTTASNFFRIRSEDHTTVATRPLITINYTIPEPSSSAMVMIFVGFSALASRRRNG